MKKGAKAISLRRMCAGLVSSCCFLVTPAAVLAQEKAGDDPSHLEEQSKREPEGQLLEPAEERPEEEPEEQSRLEPAAA